MTGPIPTPDPRDVETRPISVAELLAKNGTIGAPPVTGRRRRRRGNADAVTVAELTGEIPVIRDEVISDDVLDDTASNDDVSSDGAEPHEDDAPSGGLPLGPAPGFADGNRPTTGRQPAVVRPPRREPEPRWPKSPPQPPRGPAPEHSHYPRPQRRTEAPAASAERMRPDPVGSFTDIDVDVMDTDVPAADLPGEDSAYVRSFLSGVGGAGGAGRPGAIRPALAAGLHDDLDDLDLHDDLHDEDVPDLSGRDDDIHRAPGDRDRDRDLVGDGDGDGDGDGEQAGPPGLSGYALIVLQSVLAVVFGGGLFVGFDQLWRWNSIVALVLTVLVTLGLVAGVQVVRKTPDIVSTLIAVAVGLVVTLGPLVLHAG